MNKPRAGLGTIIGFNTTQVGYFLDFERGGTKVSRIVAPELARQLAEEYGVRDRRGGGRSTMNNLKGAAFRYRETSQGMLVEIQVLPN
jgi:hypothetical protein